MDVQVQSMSKINIKILRYFNNQIVQKRKKEKKKHKDKEKNIRIKHGNKAKHHISNQTYK